MPEHPSDVGNVWSYVRDFYIQVQKVTISSVLPSIRSSLCVEQHESFSGTYTYVDCYWIVAKIRDDTFQIWLKPDKDNKSREELRTFCLLGNEKYHGYIGY